MDYHMDVYADQEAYVNTLTGPRTGHIGQKICNTCRSATTSFWTMSPLSLMMTLWARSLGTWIASTCSQVVSMYNQSGTLCFQFGTSSTQIGFLDTQIMSWSSSSGCWRTTQLADAGRLGINVVTYCAVLEHTMISLQHAD